MAAVSIHVIALLLILAAPGGIARAGADGPDDDKDQKAAALREVKQRLKHVRLFTRAAEGEPEKEIAQPDDPVFRYSDPARSLANAAVWVFGKGRPAALVTLEKYPRDWAFELIAFDDPHVAANTADGWRWSPGKTAVQFHELPDAPAPADTEVARLRQMKNAIRAFSAMQTDERGQRYELRLVTQPIYRYADEPAGLIDGALFVLSYGTNPEIVIGLECRKSADGESRWYYGVAPSSSNACVLKLNDRDVWSKPITQVPRRQDPFAHFLEPIAFDPKD
jgi:hypothetical protein